MAHQTTLPPDVGRLLLLACVWFCGDAAETPEDLECHDGRRPVVHHSYTAAPRPQVSDGRRPVVHHSHTAALRPAHLCVYILVLQY